MRLHEKIDNNEQALVIMYVKERAGFFEDARCVYDIYNV